MATIVAAQLARPSIRHFSAHRPRPDSRAARAVAMSCIVSGVVLPFVPPALESSRQRNSNSPDSTKSFFSMGSIVEEKDQYDTAGKSCYNYGDLEQRGT